MHVACSNLLFIYCLIWFEWTSSCLALMICHMDHDCSCWPNHDKAASSAVYSWFVLSCSDMQILLLTLEPPHEKTNNLHRQKTKPQISFAVTAKLISAFVFATQMQFLFFINPKFQASGLLLCLSSLVCVRPAWKQNCWFSHTQAHS